TSTASSPTYPRSRPIIRISSNRAAKDREPQAVCAREKSRRSWPAENASSSGIWKAREDRSTACRPSRVIESAALVGGNVVGLVALDLVLRIVRRGAMGMPLVVEIAGVDGNDRAGHTAGLRIPRDMVAD